MVHIYCGEGKGKTTAAMGAVIRAAGEEMRVLVVQFFKDGSSGEIKILEKLDNVDVLYEKEHFGLYKRMTEEKKKEAALKYGRLFLCAIRTMQQYDMVIFDEIMSACNHGIVDKKDIISLMKNYAGYEGSELILTGRLPDTELLELADYVTEMKKEKHPYDQGVKARKGIEW